MKKVKRFFQNILLVIELVFYVAYLNIGTVLFIGIIALDQYTKSWIASNMLIGETIPVIQNILHITYVSNPGAAFGILSYKREFLVSLEVLMMIGGIAYYFKNKIQNKVIKFAGIFAIAGAIGNMIDRITTGFVVDLFELRFFNFPVFNVADISILIGMFMMMYVVLFKPEESGEIKEVRQP